MNKKPTTDDLLATIEWLDAYEGGDHDEDDPMHTALRVVAISLAEQAAKNLAAGWHREFTAELKSEGRRLTSNGTAAARKVQLDYATEAVNKAIAPLHRINIQI